MDALKETTQLLAGAGEGTAPDVDRLMPLVYDELRSIAAGYLRHERPNHTLRPTELVHLAYQRLVNERQVPWSGRAHFRAVAARCIRQILINHARARRAQKRGGDARPLALGSAPDPAAPRPEVDVLDLDDAMLALARVDERRCRVVELRFYGGMSVDQTAHVLGVSSRTVDEDWKFARAWLHQRLREGDVTR